MVVKQFNRADLFKKLLLGVGILSAIMFLCAGDPTPSPKHLDAGTQFPSWSSPPIFINNNTELAAFCSGNGTGTQGDPFTITYAEVTSAGASGAAIYINNTSDYLVIENCTVSGASAYLNAGIYLNNCSHVTVKGCNATDNFVGIAVAWSDNV
ncbi:MAG: right-handed parallel beta-helix repeat-containing protein, partial [Candidatus Lokiarchaeota archaeon]|nr:right-handed parallel beta-helix repeat-containing protein [Candidatus Lokiarchaeota archaeon]